LYIASQSKDFHKIPSYIALYNRFFCRWIKSICEGASSPDGREYQKGDEAMTTIYDTDEDGNIIVAFDSRWQFPETLGYSSSDPQYKALQQMWEKATQTLEKPDQNDSNLAEPNTRGKKISEEVKNAKASQG
jgi:hypothetical protein